MKQIVLAVALGLLVAGCSRSTEPSAVSGAKSGPSAAEDRIGYYEIAYGHSLYVLGSMKSLDAFRAGTKPAKTVRRFDPQGREVLFEADGLVLDKRLMAEYGRRHGNLD
ncbi:MAG: hypothetical protein ACM359_04765 [Bacillota bacterium]